jgi:hypothetical protein
MKRFIISVACLLVAGGLFAQAGVGSTNAGNIGTDTAQQKLKEVSVDKFEHEGFWTSTMSSDQGLTSSRLFAGSPSDKQPIEEEADLNIPDKYVLGTKVDFYHRGPATFTVKAAHPIPIEGITKTISVWVAGRNFNHTLKIIVQDYFGNQYKLVMGTLNFQGWKQLSVAIPPQNDYSTSGIVQQSYHYNNEIGIKIVGFEVVCDPTETVGTYYLYLDDLRAVTDLFVENSRDDDDMADAW